MCMESMSSNSERIIKLRVCRKKGLKTLTIVGIKFVLMSYPCTKCHYVYVYMVT